MFLDKDIPENPPLLILKGFQSWRLISNAGSAGCQAWLGACGSENRVPGGIGQCAGYRGFLNQEMEGGQLLEDTGSQRTQASRKKATQPMVLSVAWKREVNSFCWDSGKEQRVGILGRGLGKRSYFHSIIYSFIQQTHSEP